MVTILCVFVGVCVGMCTFVSCNVHMYTCTVLCTHVHVYVQYYLCTCIMYAIHVDDAKRFEEGLQDQKDFLYIQRRYVSGVHVQYM